MDWNLLWFLLLGVLLAGYAVLDGFDLGVGILHLAAGRRERRALIESIGPIWDGNEVWLVTFGGAMFAAFPEVYATVFSGFYAAFMLVLTCLILRAVSLEFRDKRDSEAWRQTWDVVFFASSLGASLLFGVAVGTILIGVPIDAQGMMQASLLALVFPDHLPFLPLLVGLLTVALFTLHGALFLQLKTTGDLRERTRRWMWHAFGWFMALYLFTTIVILSQVPRATANFERYWWGWLIVGATVLVFANIPRTLFKQQHLQAFASSSALIVLLVALAALALYPDLVPTSMAGGTDLTIYNAASSEHTLKIMALIAAIGMPFVVAYTAVIYWTFRGRIDVEEATGY